MPDAGGRTHRPRSPHQVATNESISDHSKADSRFLDEVRETFCIPCRTGNEYQSGSPLLNADSNSIVSRRCSPRIEDKTARAPATRESGQTGNSPLGGPVVATRDLLPGGEKRSPYSPGQAAQVVAGWGNHGRATGSLTRCQTFRLTSACSIPATNSRRRLLYNRSMGMSSQASKTHKITRNDPRHPEHVAYLTWLRGLSMEERGRMIIEACRKTAEEERARIAAGLPPIEPDPIPTDTLELFRRLIAAAKKKADSQQMPSADDAN